MKYNFDERIDRRNTGSLKWDVPDGELPMWVADMDFRTAPSVEEAIARRAAQGIFGYTALPEEWYEAYQSWWSRRHHFEIEKDWLIFCTGVVPAISSIIRKMTDTAEKVVVMTPVYNIFFNSILNNGRNVLESRLRLEDGVYDIDFADLEEKLSDPQATLLLLCNPHNPVGKIWDKETLQRIGDLCVKHHVLVLSDEIHCDLVKPGEEYIPFASVSDNCRKNSITCVAPTKAFNIAGIQTAAVIVPEETIRHKVSRGLNTDEAAEPNVFAAIAPAAAFMHGEEWLDELNRYLWENRKTAEEYIDHEIEGVTAIRAKATYLLWIDCRSVTGDSAALCGFLREHAGLYVSSGAVYRNGGGFLRMNIACPRAVLMEGLERLKNGIRAYTEQKKQ